MLLVCMGLVAYVGIRFYRNAKNSILSVSMVLYLSVLLPSYSIGYNQYAGVNYARKGFYHLPSFPGILYITDDTGKLGLRDRYGVLIKPEYESIHESDKKFDGWRCVYILQRDNYRRYYDVYNNEYIQEDEAVAYVMKTETADSLWRLPDSILADIENESLFTCISEDGRMRFHSWNTGQGGTCPDYGILCQYMTKDGNPVTVDLRDKEGEPGWVVSVHSIRKDDGKTYYITTRSHRASSDDGYMWMDGFMIDHDTLKNVSVYDGGDDLDECGLEINYSLSEWHHATLGEEGDWLFKYDAQTQNLYVPHVTYKDGTIPVVSSQFWVYHFDGQRFVEKGDTVIRINV